MFFLKNKFYLIKDFFSQDTPRLILFILDAKYICILNYTKYKLLFHNTEYISDIVNFLSHSIECKIALVLINT